MRRLRKIPGSARSVSFLICGMAMQSPRSPCYRARQQKKLRKSWIELARWSSRLVRTRALVDQNGPEIVDVGARGTGDQQVAEPGKHRIGIVSGKMRREAEPGLDGALKGIGQHERAGIVRAAVDAVGIGSYRGNPGVPIERHGEAQQEFGVAP